MKIYYDQIKEEGLALETSFAFEEENDSFSVKSFHGRVDKAGDAYMLTGDMEIDFSCSCDRCLERATLNYNEKINMTLSPLGEYPASELDDESGLSDEEAGMYVTAKDYFDLNELLREETILLAPIKRLCNDDCKGICSVCGINLNNGTCNCHMNINPKMSVLEKLKKQ